MTPTTVLWRPADRQELVLLEAADSMRWPPRRPDQPTFYPVTNEAYAIEVTSQWNVLEHGWRDVTRLEVP